MTVEHPIAGGALLDTLRGAGEREKALLGRCLCQPLHPFRIGATVR